MRIESVRIKNYKAFGDTLVHRLPALSVFLGPNGAGKTTFFDVFGFLSDALKGTVTTAVNKRGGYKELATRGSAHHPIAFEIKFRLPEKGAHVPLVTYELEIGQEQGKVVVLKEILKYRRGAQGKPWHFIDFKHGEGYAIKNESDYGKENVQEEREHHSLDAPDILAIKGLGQFKQFEAVSALRRLLEGWYVSNFRIESAQHISDVGVSEHLSTTGDNLAQVTKYLYDYHRPVFDKVVEKLKKRIPGMQGVQAIETEDGRIVLKFQDQSFADPFISRYVSDGTLKMFGYLVLLHEPDRHPLLCIEEPENYLYPELLRQLVEELREYAEDGGQVLISTHSPDLVNALTLEELFWVEKQQGLSNIYRAADNPLVAALYAEGDQLGYLWNQGYFRKP